MSDDVDKPDDDEEFTLDNVDVSDWHNPDDPILDSGEGDHYYFTREEFYMDDEFRMMIQTRCKCGYTIYKDAPPHIMVSNETSEVRVICPHCYNYLAIETNRSITMKEFKILMLEDFQQVWEEDREKIQD